MLRTQFFIVCCLAIFCGLAEAQIIINPDLSFIGDFRASFHDGCADCPDEYSKLNLDLHELEIAAGGALNPFARADVFLAIHGPQATAEIEEAYMTILRGLPLGLQLKAGQYLVDFGKLNTQHPHQWSWVERPLMHREMFGDDGLRKVGVNLNGLYPLSRWALGWSFNLLRFGGGEHHNGHDEGAEIEEEIRNDLGVSARASLFHPITEITSVEVGGSFLRFENDPVESRHATLSALDLKAKWKPDSYRSLTVISEFLTNQRPVADTTIYSGAREVSSTGMFTAMDFQFRKRFNVGGFYEMTKGVDDEEEEQTGMGFFAGFSLAEESTRFQMVLRQDEIGGSGTYQTALVQIL